MQIKSAVAVAVIATITGIGTANGVQTATAPLRSSSNGLLVCGVVNLSDTPVEVTGELYNGFNADAVDSGTLTVAPRNNRILAFSTAAIFGGYCVFEFDGNPEEVRTYIQLQDTGGSNTRLLFPAEPFGERREVDVVALTLPVRSDEGDNLICTVQNIGDGPVEIHGALEDGAGNVVDEGTLTVDPRRTFSIASSNDAIFGGFCRFTFTGNRTTVRGHIQLQDAGGSNTRLLHTASSVSPAEIEPSPTPSQTPGELPTCAPQPTPPPCTGGGCCGDCNGNGLVQINELITAVGFALNSCPAP